VRLKFNRTFSIGVHLRSALAGRIVRKVLQLLFENVPRDRRIQQPINEALEAGACFHSLLIVTRDCLPPFNGSKIKLVSRSASPSTRTRPGCGSQY